MTKSATDKCFVSELDQFLAEFNRTHPQLSLAQTEEIRKLGRIAQLRDDVEAARKNQQKCWENF